MSKIGKKAIEIPSGVTVTLGDKNKVSVKGPKGELAASFDAEIKIVIEGNELTVNPRKDIKRLYALWGLTRSLIANMIEGVVKGYEKKLELQGVGYKVVLKGNDLDLALGFSHPVLFKAPEGIKFVVEKNVITIAGIDKQSVGQVAAEIRKLRKPEPYKGKGVRYVGEQVRRKAGKKVGSGS
ncbi:MAG: 50S ribosomal protein L6 [Candidatus Pacebacteria bacterium]|jgi:large subunit ribosomal protein L6|nr:50S ribosomal protein L6 [Candidatus Paceibacterota bacterium]